MISDESGAADPVGEFRDLYSPPLRRIGISKVIFLGERFLLRPLSISTYLLFELVTLRCLVSQDFYTLPVCHSICNELTEKPGRCIVCAMGGLYV